MPSQSAHTGNKEPPHPRPPASPFFHPRSPSAIRTGTGTDIASDTIRTSNTTGTAVTEHKSGIAGCTANLTTCIVGSGIVGLPYAFAQTGFGAGILFLTLAAVLTETSLRLLVATAKHVHKQSYETVAEVPLGAWGFRFVLVNMFVIAYGAMVSYLMITKTVASLLLGVPQHDVVTQNVLLVTISFCVQLPLACRRDMAALERTSGLAVLFDCAIVVMVALVAPWWTLEGLPQAQGLWTNLLQKDFVHGSSLFAGLGVLSFALECQDAVFLIAGSLDRPTVHRWGIVTRITLSACWVLALICAITGYLAYGPATKGNILNNFPVGTVSYVAHGMLGSTMLATYPLASFVARHVCIVLLFEGPRAHEGGDDSLFIQRPDRRLILTFGLYVLALIPATLCKDMGRVLAFAGVIGGSSLAYIGPGLLHLAVHGGRFVELTKSFWEHSPNIAATPTTTTSSSASSASSPTTITTNSNDATAVDSEQTSLLHGTRNKVPVNAGSNLWKQVLWYAGGFPLWTYIAMIGHERVVAYAQRIATAKSGHSRIGDVDHAALHRLVLHEEQSSAGDNKYHHLPLTRSFSETKPGTAALVAPREFLDATSPLPYTSTTGTGSGTATATTTTITTPTTPTTPTLEMDPQERIQTWWDFALSIFFICFGMLALVAGLLSLSVSSDDDDDDNAE